MSSSKYIVTGGIIIIILPNQSMTFPYSMQKINTYNFLDFCKCPVFKSVLIDFYEEISDREIDIIQKHIKSDYFTLRYQYVVPNRSPRRGGNKLKLSIDNINNLRVNDAYLWVLEAIDDENFIIESEIIPSQFLRQIVCKKLKIFDKWDWRQQKEINKLISTVHNINKDKITYRYEKISNK